MPADDLRHGSPVDPLLRLQLSSIVILLLFVSFIHLFFALIFCFIWHTIKEGSVNFLICPYLNIYKCVYLEYTSIASNMCVCVCVCGPKREKFEKFVPIIIFKIDNL